MTFDHFERKYRNNDYLFVTGEISIGEYQIRQYELLKRYVDDALKRYIDDAFKSNFGSDAKEKGEE